MELRLALLNADDWHGQWIIPGRICGDSQAGSIGALLKQASIQYPLQRSGLVKLLLLFATLIIPGVPSLVLWCRKGAAVEEP